MHQILGAAFVDNDPRSRWSSFLARNIASKPTVPVVSSKFQRQLQYLLQRMPSWIGETSSRRRPSCTQISQAFSVDISTVDTNFMTFMSKTRDTQHGESVCFESDCFLEAIRLKARLAGP